MTSMILAWLTAEGIMCYRLVEREKRPPLPAEILSTSGLFALLALLAEADAHLAQMLAWGFNVAALLNLWPASLVTPGGGSGGGGAPAGGGAKSGGDPSPGGGPAK